MQGRSGTNGTLAATGQSGAPHPHTAIWDAPGRSAKALPDTAEQELAIAARIQSSFLPKSLPALPGWEFTVTLRPARQTCGDFYDIIPLPNGRLGLVIADVADKGTGAALYMALSRTLIRTFAILQHARPDLALNAANHRILQDTGSDLFVTVFLAVLDPRSGALSYANAGHNPPLLLRAEGQTELLASGDVLLLYTDGVTEAQRADGQMFGPQRLRRAAETRRRQQAQVIEAGVFADLQHFVQAAPQFDDIALMVVKHTGTGTQVV